VSDPLDDDDTWEEEPGMAAPEPLEIRFSIQPKASRLRPESRENALRLFAELAEPPEEERPRRLRERRFQEPALLDLLLEACHSALSFDARRSVELAFRLQGVPLQPVPFA
jgi:hypothetical protein